MYIKLHNNKYNRESGDYFKNQIRELGGTVEATFGEDCTHLIWSHGLSKRFKTAQYMDVKVVSPLWIDQCRQAKKKVPEEDFNATPSIFHENSAETGSFITAVQSIIGTASSSSSSNASASASISSKSNSSTGNISSSNSSKTAVQATTTSNSSKKSLNLGKSSVDNNSSSKGSSILSSSSSKSGSKGIYIYI